jgi:hypothetical protein
MWNHTSDWWDLAVKTTITFKNKPIELLTSVLFDICYMFQSTFGSIFRQSHQIRLLLLNCANMNPYLCYSSQSHATVMKLNFFSNFKIFLILNFNFKLFKFLLSLNVKFYIIFVLLSFILRCPYSGIRCYTMWK